MTPTDAFVEMMDVIAVEVVELPLRYQLLEFTWKYALTAAQQPSTPEQAERLVQLSHAMRRIATDAEEPVLQ